MMLYFDAGIYNAILLEKSDKWISYDGFNHEISNIWWGHLFSYLTLIVTEHWCSLCVCMCVHFHFKVCYPELLMD